MLEADVTALVAMVDFGTIVVGIISIAGILATLFVTLRGVQMLLQYIKGRKAA